MSYSSALYDTSVIDRGDHLAAAPPEGQHSESLAEAQARKIERLLDQTGVGEGSRVLEIGTGWGELAIRAARPRRHRALGDPVERAARAGRGARRRGRVRRPGEHRAQRLPRRAGSVRRRRLGGDDRGRRATSTGRRTSRPSTACSLPAARSGSRRSRCRTTGCSRPGARGRGSTSTSSPEASCPRSPRSTRSPARTPRCGSPSGSPSGSTTRRRWSAGTGPSAPPARRSASSASTSTFQRMWHFYLEYSRAGFASGYIDVQQLTFERAGRA